MKKLALLISSTLLVTACGGGGSGDGVSTTSSNGKTKITTESINNMSTSIGNIDFDTALNVVNSFRSNGSQGISSASNQLDKTTACFNGSGDVVLTTSGNEDTNNGSLSINSCSLSYDLNIKVNGKLNYSKAGNAYTLSGFFSITDENKAEELLSFKNIDFKYTDPILAFSSTVSAGGETHGVNIKNSNNSDTAISTTSIKVEGAAGTWFQIDQTTNTQSGTLTSCKLTQSSNLSFAESDVCN